jgi:GNAT superfamily N-acetyltransferase
MNTMNPPEPLRTEHNTAPFNCGKDPLNEFLQKHALDKQNAMLSRTFVVTTSTPATDSEESARSSTDSENTVVIGYYTLAHAVVLQSEAPKKLSRGMPSSIPVMLMARFAIDLHYQGLGLGRSLFTDAIRRTWAVMHSGAAPVRFFIVDAKDEEAKAFYQRFDMIPSAHNERRLYLSYKTLRQLFAENEN